ncbi:MAG: hypothetical protein V4581_01790, partial [Bacteroidota bacterium]
MKSFYSLLVIFCFSFYATAQRPERPQRASAANATPKDTAYVNTYNKLRTLYVKQLDSETYKKAHKLSMEFAKKTKFDGDFATLTEEDSMLKWIKDNLDKTSFTSYEEAVKLNKEQEAAFEVDQKENAEYYAFAKIARQKYPKITVDVMLNKGTGEDPKESEEYKAAYTKLKDLFIKQKSSASYLKAESLRQEFYKKSNFDFKKDKLENGTSIMTWVKQNLSKTG